MSRVSTRFLVAFSGLTLLCCGLLCVLAIPLTRLDVTDATFTCFVFPFAIVCVALLILVGAGALPKSFYCDRTMLIIGLAAWVVGTLLLWIASDESSHGMTLSILAGLFCGISIAASLASWLSRLPETGTPAFAACMFGPLCLSALLCIPMSAIPCADVFLALVAGVGAQILGSISPSLKNIPHRPGAVKVVATQRTFFIYMGVFVGLWALALSYSTCHFFPMVVESPSWMPLLSLALIMLLLWGITQGATRINRTQRVTPFASIKVYPIVLAVGVVPLNYLKETAAFLQPMCLIGLFGATAAILLFLAWECASMTSASALLCLGFTWGCAFIGAAGGFFFESFVNTRTDTLFWAIAPLVCLVIGITVCDFFLTEPSLSKMLVSHGDSKESAFATSKLGLQCRQVAREHNLTSRELEVLDLLVQGYSLTYVCEKLVIAAGTAATHKQRIYKKFDVHTKNELIDLVSAAEPKES